jgi:hypothetical protein
MAAHIADLRLDSAAKKKESCKGRNKTDYQVANNNDHHITYNHAGHGLHIAIPVATNRKLLNCSIP